MERTEDFHPSLKSIETEIKLDQSDVDIDCIPGWSTSSISNPQLITRGVGLLCVTYAKTDNDSFHPRTNFINYLWCSCSNSDRNIFWYPNIFLFTVGVDNAKYRSFSSINQVIATGEIFLTDMDLHKMFDSTCFVQTTRVNVY